MFNFLLLILPILCDGEPVDNYFKQRKQFVYRDTIQQAGFDMLLSPEEQIVDRFFLKLKQKELDEEKALDHTLQEENFITAKDEIDKSNVYKFIKKMPKGAINHIHDLALGSYVPLIKKWTYNQDCFMCHDTKRNQLSFKITTTTPVSLPGCSWVSVPVARSNASNVQEFDDYLLSFLTLTKKDIVTLKTQNEIWKKFQSVFTSILGLLSYEEIFKEYMNYSLEELLADNIQFVEIRATLPPLYKLDGSVVNHPSYTLKTSIMVGEEFRKRNMPNYFGTKYIYSVLRALPVAEVSKTITIAMDMFEKYGNYMAGYDLVGQEDKGFPLKDFIKPLLAPGNLGKHLPYIFHAGETDWQGESMDENLFDAVLLNSSRIGHGFALTKHPYLKLEASQKNIAVELCPISNQVLGLVSDIRDHPGSTLLAEDFPVTINPDDPPIWGASGVSYDFYHVLMGMTPANSGLGVLKKLALNSIRYSSLSNKEKHQLTIMWYSKWNTFIKNSIAEYNL